MDIISHISNWIDHFHLIGYGVAFFASFLETIIAFGWFLPGSTIVLFLGTLAGQGYFNVYYLILYSVIGAILGDNFNYFLGRYLGDRVFKKGFWFLKPKFFKKREKFFQEHGGKSIFFGRFVPSIKEVMPLIAGTFRMSITRFMVWNVLGAFGWSILWISLGFFLSQSFELAAYWLTRTSFFIVVLIFIFVVLYILKVFIVKQGKNLLSFIISVLRSISDAIKQNPDVKRLRNKYPKTFNFLYNRFQNKTFWGLKFTVLLLLFLYHLFLLFVLIKSMMNKGIITFGDIRIENLLLVFRNKNIIDIFYWITLLGKWQVVVFWTFLFSMFFYFHKKKEFIFPLIVSVFGSGFVTFIMKLIFKRVRPSLAVYQETSFSFPSGHSAIAVGLYGFLGYFFFRFLKKWKYKINFLFLSILVILLIGFSRLYLGVHYFSDVIGGYLVGLLLLFISIGILEFIIDGSIKRRLMSFKLSKKPLIIYSSIGIIFFLVFGLFFAEPIYTHSDNVQSISIVEIDNVFSIFENENLKYSETIFGRKQEPLNFIILAKSDKDLIKIFHQAGWSLGDPVNIRTVYKVGKSALLKQSYKTAPMTPSFWNSRVNDFGFQREIGNVRVRHHARFWRTGYKKGEYLIYVGTASFDIGIKWGITHKIDPDIDTEREILFEDLYKTGLIKKFYKVNFVKPTLGKNFVGDIFFTDGKAYYIEMK